MMGALWSGSVCGGMLERYRVDHDHSVIVPAFRRFSTDPLQAVGLINRAFSRYNGRLLEAL
jgi:hypothetical protein